MSGTILAWSHGPEGWAPVPVRKPTSADRRPPYPRESVKVRSFWDRRGTGLVFHRRWGPGTFCDPQNLHRSEPCGHALPLEVAEKIARPCRKCYPHDD